MGKMKLAFKNVVQIIVYIVVLTTVNSAHIPGKTGISKIHEIPQYRFHYFLQDDKTENHKPNEGSKNVEKIQGSYNLIESKGDVRIVNYRVNKSNDLRADVDTKSSTSPLKISLNNPTYNFKINDLKESTIPAEASPIVVQPLINTEEQKSSKSVIMDSRNEYNLAESTDKTTQLADQVSTNQTEDRKDDVKDEQTTDQILIQDQSITNKQTEFTIPFKKPIQVNIEDLKYNDDEAMKKDIVKVIQNINGEHEQPDLQTQFKSVMSDKPFKIFSEDSIEMEQQENYHSNQGHSDFKSQQLSKKPLRLFGYNPSVFGSLYDMQIGYNRPSQIQQPPNSFNQGYFAGFGAYGDDFKSQTYDSSGTYLSQPSSAFQTSSYKGNQKHNVPTPTQPLYYYDPNSMVMLPVYTNMLKNTYPFVENNPQSAYPIVENKPHSPYPVAENKPHSPYPVAENKPHLAYPGAENKPHPSQSQSDSSKGSFNLMQILSGGSFYKGLEQAEGSQQTAVNDFVKQESNKLEKTKASEANDKLKLPQTMMFYLNPGETSIDFKSLTSSPMQLTYGQQSKADCNSQKLKIPVVQADKSLQPIPLCSDCVPTLGLMGLPSTKSATVQQKKSITSPQVMPIWNGQNVSKLSYLILPNPITKK